MENQEVKRVRHNGPKFGVIVYDDRVRTWNIDPRRDVALHFYACIDEPLEIAPDQEVVIDTGIGLRVPPGYFAMITSKPELQALHNLVITNAIETVHPAFLKRIRLRVTNFGNETYIMSPMAHFAQVIIIPALTSSYKITEEELRKEMRNAWKTAEAAE